MSRAAYRERDYAFGQTVFTLRSKIGLTQSAIANQLGVSRQTISDWEAGNSYPSAQHLKALMTLAMRHQGFTAGQEAEEIRGLWQAAHQKGLLDEDWLAELMASATEQRSCPATGTGDTPASGRQQEAERLAQNYRLLVESISEGVSTITVNGVITSLSPAFETITGWSTEQLIGNNLRSVIHPVDLPLALERLQRDQNGQPQPPTRLRLLQSSGEYRPVEISSQPLDDGQNRTIWLLVRDLAKDEQFAQQQQQLVQETQRVQWLRHLIRSTATRARPPLDAVGKLTHRIAQRPSDPETHSEAKAIETHVQGLTHLVERILTMAELDADRSPFSFGPVQLNRVADFLLLNSRPQAEARQITITGDATPNLPFVRADEGQLYRAAQEIVTNALEHTPRDGAVILSTHATDTHGVLIIHDTGMGIPAELIPHLFEEFYQFSDPNAVSEKLGLGLPIAKKIIDKHRGTIAIESVPRRSIITLQIPRYDA